MEIVSFEGGINTRLNPQYVKSNQAVQLNDVDVFDGTLKSGRKSVALPLGTIGSYFYKFRGEMVSESSPSSFVEYDKKLFISTPTTTQYTTDGINRKTLGANPPSETALLNLSVLTWAVAPAITEGEDLDSAEFEYRIVQVPTDILEETYTYKADIDTRSSAFGMVIVTFDVSGFLGVTTLYREIDDVFVRVAEVTDDGQLIDGAIVQNPTQPITLDSPLLGEKAARKSMCHLQVGGLLGKDYYLIGDSTYEFDRDTNISRRLVGMPPMPEDKTPYLEADLQIHQELDIHEDSSYQLFTANGKVFAFTKTYVQYRVETSYPSFCCHYEYIPYPCPTWSNPFKWCKERSPCMPYKCYNVFTDVYTHLITRICELDGNVWQPITATYKKLTLSEGDNNLLVFGMALSNLKYADIVGKTFFVEDGDNTLIVRTKDGFFQRFNGALSSPAESNVPIMSNVIDVMHSSWEEEGKTYLYYTIGSGSVHKLELGGSSTLDSELFGVGRIPLNSGKSLLPGGVAHTNIDDYILAIAYEDGFLLYNTATRATYAKAVDFRLLDAYMTNPGRISLSDPSDEKLTLVRSHIDIALISSTEMLHPVLDGSFNYVYTFSDLDIETSRSNSTSIEIKKGNVLVDLVDIDATTLDSVNLYREGGNINTLANTDYLYRLIERLDIGTLTTIDNVPIGDLMGNRTTPTEITNESRDDLQHLVYHRGRLFGAASDVADAGDFEPTAIKEYPDVNTAKLFWRCSVDYTFTSGDLDGQTILDGQYLMWNGLAFIIELQRPSTDRDKLYFSGLGEPLLWQDVDYLLFPKPITGLGTTSNGLVVFTANSIYVMLGNTTTNFSIVTISEFDGTLAPQSVVPYKGSLFFLGRHGICSTNGGTIQNISRGSLGDLANVESMFAAVVDDVYYLDVDTAILAYDFRANPMFRTITKGEIKGMANIDGTLQLRNFGVLHQADYGEPTELTYQSSLLGQGGVNMLKEYIRVWFRYVGIFEVKVLIDGATVADIKLDSSSVVTYRYNLPKTAHSGYGMTIQAKGVGQIFGIEFQQNIRID